LGYFIKAEWCFEKSKHIDETHLETMYDLTQLILVYLIIYLFI